MKGYPPIVKGDEVRLRDLADYAALFDRISEGATYSAVEFVAWMQREGKAQPHIPGARCARSSSTSD